MGNLNQLVSKYLNENGITSKFFANYIGCEYTKCSRWLNENGGKLNSDQMKKVHDFLSGKHHKAVEEII